LKFVKYLIFLYIKRFKPGIQENVQRKATVLFWLCPN